MGLPVLRKRVQLAALAVLMCATWSGLYTDARADTFLDSLAGNWQGGGYVKSEPSAKEEAIRCRLNLAATSAKNRLFVRGQCSIAGLILPVNGSITVSRNVYSADLFKSIVRVTTNSFSGRRKGVSLTLIYNGTDRATKRPIRAAMTIRKRKAGFDISLGRSKPNSRQFFNIGTIRFKAN